MDYRVGDRVWVKITDDLTPALCNYTRRYRQDRVPGTIWRIRNNGQLDVEFDLPYYNYARNEDRVGSNVVFSSNCELMNSTTGLNNSLEAFPQKKEVAG